MRPEIKRLANLNANRRAAVALGCVVAFVAVFRLVSLDVASLDEAFARGNRMLFDAKFRNRASYERHFGFDESSLSAPSTGFDPPSPVGHWQAERGAP